MEGRYAPAVSGTDQEGNTVFSLIHSRRGDVARIIFFMSIRWGLDIVDYEEDNLRAWHIADPVSNWEIERDQRVELLQGNRNPFVHCPELIDRISDFSEHNYSVRESLPAP